MTLEEAKAVAVALTDAYNWVGFKKLIDHLNTQVRNVVFTIDENDTVEAYPDF